MTTLVPPITFQNIMVWVKPRAGVPNKYDVVTEPAAPQILNADTVINYQIVGTDGYPIVFKGMSVKPEHNGQLSKEVVSVDGRLLTFSDLNTIKMTLNITLKFQDKEGIEFSHDPQIHNDPQS
ncbi:hypothetical protein [Duganella violaceipulchra]|uniref:Uncharacterized protein n=1 Tax=Duganella violaceipulchra TaxID=2849652 RepID=A0AA41H8I8_9BURK|nr:hypothetical protein [Duganella violaceicalia]MBV6322574.1 hypothetical protein [Duganella violaceicalia]MCP2010786.1 hypothetical protein [Duganella violaceicalia]